MDVALVPWMWPCTLACEGRGAKGIFGGFEGWQRAALNANKISLEGRGAKGTFGGFEAWQTAALNANKKLWMWTWCLGLRGKRCQRVMAALNAIKKLWMWPWCLRLRVGMPLLPWQATKEPSPHLRWSQAPPLPWHRPGSADFYLYIYI